MPGREGSEPKVLRAFYTAVTQAVLLFGEEMWVLTPRMEKALDSFHSRFVRKITGRQPRQRKDWRWIYPPLAGIMKEAGMVGIRTSILRRQNTVARTDGDRPEGSVRKGSVSSGGNENIVGVRG